MQEKASGSSCTAAGCLMTRAHAPRCRTSGAGFSCRYNPCKSHDLDTTCRKSRNIFPRCRTKTPQSCSCSAHLIQTPSPYMGAILTPRDEPVRVDDAITLPAELAAEGAHLPPFVFAGDVQLIEL